MAPPARGGASGVPPRGFTIRRELSLGEHPILTAFPRLNRLDCAARLEPDPESRERLFDRTVIRIVAEDVWMYVAPWKETPRRTGGWIPVAPDGLDCVVIGEGHYRRSPELTVFLDIFHELRHVMQRRGGAELFPPGVSYVERPTEIDAYRFVVEEARLLGVDDATLREYLRVEWIDDAEFSRLLRAVGVSRS